MPKKFAGQPAGASRPMGASRGPNTACVQLARSFSLLSFSSCGLCAVNGLVSL